jgi:pyridoxine 5-phosphate synthase
MFRFSGPEGRETIAVDAGSTAWIGRDPQSAAVVAELAKIREAGAAIRALGMRFNAGHALNYFNVQSIAAMPGVRELHIGHAIVSRAVFVGLREAVRQMKALLREAAAG